MKWSLGFDALALVAVLVLYGALAAAEQPSTPVLSAGVGTVNVKAGTPVYENGVCKLNCPPTRDPHPSAQAWKCEAHGLAKIDANGLVTCVKRDDDGDHQRAAHKELAGTRLSLPPDSSGTYLKLPQKTPDVQFKTENPSDKVTFATVIRGPAQLVMAHPCTKMDNNYSLTINDGNGDPIVTINQCTGKVSVTHPERMDRQAREFWRTVQKAWPEVCAPRLKAPKK